MSLWLLIWGTKVLEAWCFSPFVLVIFYFVGRTTFSESENEDEEDKLIAVVINPWKDESCFDLFRNWLVSPDGKRKSPRQAKQDKRQFFINEYLIIEEIKLKMKEKQGL